MRLVYVAIVWCTGILLAANNRPGSPVLWGAASALALAAVVLVWRQRPRRHLHLLIAVLMLGGWRFTSVPLSSPLAAYNGRGGVTVEGTLISAPVLRGERMQVRIAAERVETAGRVQPASGVALVETPIRTGFSYGDRVRATGDLFTPPTYDTFSYADFLARSGIYSLMPNAHIQVVESEHGFSAMSALLSLRQTAQARIARAMPEPYAGLLTGILLGDESGIAPEIEDAFAATGAAHVIAISGYNMALLAGIMIAVFKRLRVQPRRAAVFSIGLLAVYTVFVGAAPGVVRAALMSSLLIVGDLIVQRKTFLPASLAFAALVLSIINPMVLWDVGFQLSLFATLGIALLAKPLTTVLSRPLENWLRPRPAALAIGILEPTLVVSLSAQVLVLPLIALYFERLSLVSLAVNLLIVPVQPLVLILGGVATLIDLLVQGAGQPLYWAAMIALAWTTEVVRAFAELPFAEIVVQPHPNLIAVFFVSFIGAAMTQAAKPEWIERAAGWLRRRTMVAALIGTAAALSTLLAAIITSRPDGRLHIWLLDMGHSHAVLAQTPGGAHILIDGGRFPTRLLLALGDRLPFNDREIELMVITQPDFFEIGALPDVLARYTTGLIVTNGQPNLSPAYTTLQAAWSDRRTMTAQAGQRILFSDGAAVDVLHPPNPPMLSDRLDDGALTLRLSFGDASFLITSDVSGRAQARIAAEGQLQPSAVLILPQHGAAGALDDTFLTAASPQVILLQADAANRLGHPDPDTLAKVADLPLFRTDVSGTLHLYTDGTTLWIERARGS